MKLAETYTRPSIVSKSLKRYKIQSYDINNDFPQKVIDLVNSSITARGCINTYARFIGGKGFKDESLARFIINRDGETMDDLLQFIKYDFARFNGFAIHVNYNELCRITELYHVPFENVRLQLPDETGYFNGVAIHPDWTNRNKYIKKFNAKDIDYIDLFDPNPEAVEYGINSVGGNFLNYKGQVLYYSGDGVKTYPLPIYVAAFTDMRTEEAVSNVVGRSAANNFSTAGLLIDVQDEDQTEEQRLAKQNKITEYLGDFNAGQLMYAQVNNKDEIPQVIPFKGTNYDKEFEQTQSVVPDNIGRSFMQPAILRAKDVAGNIGADLIRNSYHFYNSITDDERLTIERVVTDIFIHWHTYITFSDYSIDPLDYYVGNSILDKYGSTVAKDVADLMAREDLTEKQKKNILNISYGLNKEDINTLFIKE